MARVVSKLKNQPLEVTTHLGKVKFTEDKGQLLSEEVSDEMALHLASIEGYSILPDKKSGKNQEPPTT